MVDLVGYRDDLDGTEAAAPTVDRYHFAFGRKDQMVTWEIDLTEDNYGRLQEALQEFLAVAREPKDAGRTAKTPRRRSPNGTRQAPASKAVTAQGKTMSEVRTWLRENQKEPVGDRGALKTTWRALWNEKHPDDQLN